MLQIISHTPLWVFILFFFLLWLGFSQSKSRNVSAKALYILPAAMTLLSLYSAVSFPVGGIAALAAYPAGMLAGFMTAGLCRLRGVLYAPEQAKYHIPGSYFPLAAMMAIFFVKYAVGASLSMKLPFIFSPVFPVVVCLLYGVFSGLFIGRGVAITRCSKREGCLVDALPEIPARASGGGIRHILGYVWAGLALLAALTTFMGNRQLSAGLAAATGVKISPWETGGDVIGTVDHANYRTIIHRPVFDGLLSERSRGFVQVRWESATGLPALIEETVAVPDKRDIRFAVRIDTVNGKAELFGTSPAVTGVEKLIRLKNGYALRIALQQ